MFNLIFNFKAKLNFQINIHHIFLQNQLFMYYYHILKSFRNLLLKII